MYHGTESSREAIRFVFLSGEGHPIHLGATIRNQLMTHSLSLHRIVKGAPAQCSLPSRTAITPKAESNHRSMFILKRRKNQAIVLADCIFISITEIAPNEVCLKFSVDEHTSIEQYRTALAQINRTENTERFDNIETLPEPWKVTVRYHHCLELTGHVSIIFLERIEDCVRCGVEAWDDRLVKRKEVWEALRLDV